MKLSERLAELGHELPVLTAPVANYLHATHDGNLLAIAGQIGNSGAAKNGPVGMGMDVAAARQEAQLAALKVLAVLDRALGGDLGRIRQVLRLGVFVAAGATFEDHGKVADAASDLLVAVLGDAGHHARAAVGVASLPRGAVVEIDALVALQP